MSAHADLDQLHIATQALVTAICDIQHRILVPGDQSDLAEAVLNLGDAYGAHAGITKSLVGELERLGLSSSFLLPCARAGELFIAMRVAAQLDASTMMPSNGAELDRIVTGWPRFCELAALKIPALDRFGDGLRVRADYLAAVRARDEKAPTATRPRWDADRRELWFGENVCKRYRQAAPKQELILAAFEEEGWPARIDDPLTHGPDDDARQRLSDAIRKLNNNHNHIVFELDGTGEGILWKPRGP